MRITLKNQSVDSLRHLARRHRTLRQRSNSPIQTIPRPQRTLRRFISPSTPVDFRRPSSPDRSALPCPLAREKPDRGRTVKSGLKAVTFGDAPSSSETGCKRGGLVCLWQECRAGDGPSRPSRYAVARAAPALTARLRPGKGLSKPIRRDGSGALHQRREE